MKNNLDAAASAVLDRLKAEGALLPKQIQAQLTDAGIPADRWKEVVALLKPRIQFRKGRYVFVPPLSTRVREEKKRRQTHVRAVRDLIRAYQKIVVARERREFKRVHFIKPVTFESDDGRSFQLLSQDISYSGLRLVGTTNLQGLKGAVHIPQEDMGGGQWSFRLHVLWSVPAGDGLIVSGAVFLP
ncbi:MAG: hypothetical protein KatS3mg105_0226 [Gemmatales bacterium]|nr:MAG: hypothetical protein KatS3mg105_0226 [Gemmatales bacterium]